MSLRYATGLDLGLKKRRKGGINEDSIAVNILEDDHLGAERNAGVFVVADGAGGREAGEIASYVASVEVAQRLTNMLWDTRHFEDVFQNTPNGSTELDRASVTEPITNRDPDWLLQRIETIIRSTHTQILHTIQDLGLESAYTTIVAGVKVGDRFYFGWVGDSRAYVLNRHPNRAEDKQIQLLTRDHSLVENMAQRGEISEVEALVHSQGHSITRALGGTQQDKPGESTVQVDTRQVKLFSDDIVLLTSDGLIDAFIDAPKLHKKYKNADYPSQVEQEIKEKAVTDDEIFETVHSAESLEKATNKLLALANKRGGKDNISLILFQDSGLAQSPASDIPSREHESDSEPVDEMQTLIRDPT